MEAGLEQRPFLCPVVGALLGEPGHRTDSAPLKLSLQRHHVSAGAPGAEREFARPPALASTSSSVHVAPAVQSERGTDVPPSPAPHSDILSQFSLLLHSMRQQNSSGHRSSDGGAPPTPPPSQAVPPRSGAASAEAPIPPLPALADPIVLAVPPVSIPPAGLAQAPVGSQPATSAPEDGLISRKRDLERGRSRSALFLPGLGPS